MEAAQQKQARAPAQAGPKEQVPPPVRQEEIEVPTPVVEQAEERAESEEEVQATVPLDEIQPEREIEEQQVEMEASEAEALPHVEELGETEVEQEAVLHDEQQEEFANTPDAVDQGQEEEVVADEDAQESEEVLEHATQELTQETEPEIPLADTHERFEEQQRELDEKLKKIREELFQKMESLHRQFETESRRKLDEEIRKLAEEKHALESEKELSEKGRERIADEVKRTVKSEIAFFKGGFDSREVFGKLEQEFRAWQETERKRQEEESRREAEEKEEKIREMMDHAREFFSLKQYNEALIEITRVYSLDPTSGEARFLEAEIRKIEHEERKEQLERKLDEMKQQIGELSRAVEQEKDAREELNNVNVQRALVKFRTASEKAWANGAPDAKTREELHRLALSLALPESVEHSIRREVKLAMYGRAVKEAIARRHLMRDSSSTLEWLRKVYEISIDEYLEYESKFLMDLVADQYKGSILLVSSDESTKAGIVNKLKSSGYAVVLAQSPEEALEKIEKLYPNFVFCEMEFPAGSISGIKFLHILRSNSKYSYLPFILFCDPERLDEVQLSDLRSNESYLEKPLDFGRLLETMDVMLEAFKKYIASLT